MKITYYTVKYLKVGFDDNFLFKYKYIVDKQYSIRNLAKFRIRIGILLYDICSKFFSHKLTCELND